MRKASEVERFPYMSAAVCYIEVKTDGTTNQVNRSELKDVYQEYDENTPILLGGG
mgnify:CR=1 FL=1